MRRSRGGTRSGVRPLSAHSQNKLATARSNPIKLKEYAVGGLILSDHGLSERLFSRFCAIFRDECRCWQNFGSSRRSQIALAPVVQVELAGTHEESRRSAHVCLLRSGPSDSAVVWHAGRPEMCPSEEVDGTRTHARLPGFMHSFCMILTATIPASERLEAKRTATAASGFRLP